MDWFVIVLIILLSICVLLLSIYLVCIFIDPSCKKDNDDDTNSLLNTIHLHNLIRGGF
jgi:hypothetical protein